MANVSGMLAAAAMAATAVAAASASATAPVANTTLTPKARGVVPSGGRGGFVEGTFLVGWMYLVSQNRFCSYVIMFQFSSV